MIGLGPTLGPVSWHEKLRRVLARCRGARLGEATVISRQIHVSDQAQPHAVTVLTDMDFGQSAYAREQLGEVIHIDVFHAVAEVDHRQVAAAVVAAMAGTPATAPGQEGRLLADCFDLCTATGGGRLTGSLNTVRKLSVKVAHRNHVHLAGLLPSDRLPILLQVVRVVEQSILDQGVELRRIERVGHRRGAAGPSEQSDLSRYYGESIDSLIKGSGREQPAGPSGDGQSLRAGRGGQGAGRTGGAASSLSPAPANGSAVAQGGEASGSEVGGEPGAAPGQPGEGGDPWGEEERLQQALDLSRRLGSPEEVRRVLEELSREQGWTALYSNGGNQAPFVMRQLEEAGLLRKEVRGMRLTEEGRAMLSFLRRHLKDVKLRFRKLIRRIPGRQSGVAQRNRPGRGAPSAEVRYGLIRGTAPAQPGAWLNDLAVPETVAAAVRRSHLERCNAGAERARLMLDREDLHVYLRASEHLLHICLLIDASASMAGRRILAAKHLARHLLVSTRDKLAVIAFQERDVRVFVPFTRDYGLVEDGLARIQPMGLTPLAHGLTQSMELIRSSRVRRPLLLLITDGIPTVPKWTIDPLADALEAARQVKGGRIPFGCIGLQPSRRYLDQLTREAGGTLHVVDELSEEALVRIAHLEREKLSQKAH